jgi:hypothetical protein
MPWPLRTRAAWRSGDLPKKILEDSLRRGAQPDPLDFRSRDKPALERLPQCLPQKTAHNGIGFD